ncbi:ketol-acid reductoisomerase [candidate division MSBL1 archaeon SCGC-AAA259E19]|uniref:Ketol-acid reductoisomerase n=1 Tax=candidate division MSBL1 archaeon SCGC-AAA259E19 TaxID=1698264 RepID=A0A133UDC2_9EURY|nr:ketol-acid reductoisomerase [candidate division MSBL1 archaeon SCGC-AAA259E19]
MTGTNIYYDSDASLDYLEDRTIAIIGYGNQGRAQALNMRDSGVKDIIVGNIEDESWKQAEDDGFQICSISEAAERGDVLFVLVPDEVAPDVFESEILDNLEENDVLNFASGYNITFDFIQPHDYVDVTMVAPRMIGETVRELYKDGDGAPALLAVNQDYSGKASEISLAIAKAIGATRSGAIEGTFEMEMKSDLLTEQGLFPIILNALMAKHEIEIEEGFPPELILTEEYLSREIAHIFEEMAKRGVLGQMPLHSRTSQYGQLSRTDQIYEGESNLDYEMIRFFMKKQLNNIDTGEFAREWSSEQKHGRSGLKRLYKKYRESKFIEDEQKTMKRLGLKEED